MKVLHVTTDFPFERDGKLANYGGLGLCVLQLVEGLREKGVDVDVLSRSEGSIDREITDGVIRAPFIKLSGSRDWKLTHGITLVPWLLTCFSMKNYDIVHVHNPPAGMLALPVSTLFGYKTVMTMHGPWAKVRDRFASLANAIEFHTLMCADAVTFDSNSLLRMYANDQRYHAIQNAVDTNVFKHMMTHRARARFSLDMEKRIFLYSGRNVFGKNVDVIRKMAAKFPNDIFLVTGWQGNATDEEFSNITYMKSIPNTEMPWLYSACDGLILASSAEGMSRAVLEAMSCGCAPILSDIPANTETAGNCGRYFKDADGLGWILEDISRKDMAEMGMKSREHILKNFTVSRRIESFIKVYEGLSKR